MLVALGAGSGECDGERVSQSAAGSSVVGSAIGSRAGGEVEGGALRRSRPAEVGATAGREPLAGAGASTGTTVRSTAPACPPPSAKEVEDEPNSTVGRTKDCPMTVPATPHEMISPRASVGARSHRDDECLPMLSPVLSCPLSNFGKYDTDRTGSPVLEIGGLPNFGKGPTV